MHVLALAKLFERFLNGLLRLIEFSQETLDRLIGSGGLVEVREDQFALASGVARVDYQFNVVPISDKTVNGSKLLLRLLVVRPRV